MNGVTDNAPLPRVGVISVGEMKTTVFAGGRFNPPTRGHDRLIRLVHAYAQRMGADHCISVVRGIASGTDPLPAKQKLDHLKRLWPQTHFTLQPDEQPDFDSQFVRIARNGTQHLVIVVGEDREATFRARLQKINGKGADKLVNFRLVSMAVEPRMADADGQVTVSSSLARNFALKDDYAGFRAILPDHIIEDHARELFADVRDALQKALARG
jgi:Cytidylyltransferase-like